MKQISFMEKVINCVNDAVKEIKSIVTDYNDYGFYKYEGNFNEYVSNVLNK